MFLYILLILSGVLCDDPYVGYSLNIGRAVDLFANYGDLSQVTQVVSTEYEEDEEEEVPLEPFREQNIKIFTNASSREVDSGLDQNMSLMFCDTIEDLLDSYFRDFLIEGSSKPWKAFMGNWMSEEIMRTLGIPYDHQTDNCCYVLAKLSKIHRSVKMDPITTPAPLEKYLKKAIANLVANDIAPFRMFMKNYGTHYIESYVTGNFVYQVFKYKRNGYNLLKAYTKRQNPSNRRTDDLRFYFSSLFLKHVGDIKIASGNKSIEEWAKDNLKDSQYLYSRPSLLKLYYNPSLVNRLSERLDNGALLAMNLRTLRPIFDDKDIGNKFAEIVYNDLQLWEINA